MVGKKREIKGVRKGKERSRVRVERRMKNRTEQNRTEQNRTEQKRREEKRREEERTEEEEKLNMITTTTTITIKPHKKKQNIII